MSIKNAITDFLNIHWDGESPLLLGYSGGADSKALLYGLLEAGCRKLHLAHIDHGWRVESMEEAEALAKEAEHLKLPFHSIRLSSVPSFNQEEFARKERLLFFQSLYGRLGCRALLLAHHQSDLAETVLKRVLEGAHLPFLGGMEPRGGLDGMEVWRPLLNVCRSEIISFLQEKSLSFYQDSSNLDPKYLRARMRQQILPDLAKVFGKEIEENLALLGKRAFEYRSYLDRKISSCPSFQGPWGVRYSLSTLDRIEARHLLQNQIKMAGKNWSRSFLERVLDAAFSNKANIWVESIWIDRGEVFFFKADLPRFGTDFLEISPGCHRWGDWQVVIEEASKPLPFCSWRSIWTGRFALTLPRGYLGLSVAPTEFRHLWNKEKVPVFFRSQVPLFWKKGASIEKPLSQKEKVFRSGKGAAEFFCRGQADSSLEPPLGEKDCVEPPFQELLTGRAKRGFLDEGRLFQVSFSIA